MQSVHGVSPCSHLQLSTSWLALQQRSRFPLHVPQMLPDGQCAFAAKSRLSLVLGLPISKPWLALRTPAQVTCPWYLGISRYRTAPNMSLLKVATQHAPNCLNSGATEAPRYLGLGPSTITLLHGQNHQVAAGASPSHSASCPNRVFARSCRLANY
jgi:hypothetical protein